MPDLVRPEGSEPDDFRFSRRALATGGLGGLFFAGYAPAALAAQARPVTTDDAGLVTANVSCPAPDGFDLPAYAARPRGDGQETLAVTRPASSVVTGLAWAASAAGA